MPVTPPHRPPPSGEQHDIGHGGQRAVIAEVGATLRSYTVDGVDVVDGFGVDQLCDFGRGQVLAPWPNRLADGGYSFSGREAHAALDEPDRHNAIHGLVRWLPWRVVSRVQNRISLRCVLYPQPGYPWRLELSIEYRLGRGGLSVTFDANNTDDGVAPFGVGFHPYLTLGAEVDSVALMVPAAQRMLTDERGLPVGLRPVAGSEFDFTARRWIGPTRLDTAYTDFQRRADGLMCVDLDDAAGGRGVTVWMDAQFKYVMVFSGDTIEPPERRRRSLAVEPMSCPPDALRSGVDVVALEPGASWQGTWGLTPR